MSRRERARQMAYVPQSSMLNFPYEVRDVVLMGRVAHLGLGLSPSVRDRAIAERAMDRLGVTHLASRTYQQLSGGERQLVLVARALAQQAAVLILDEPTAALDFSNQARVLTIVRELAEDGYAILMTSHSPDHAFLAGQRSLLLRDGTTFRLGPTEEVVTAETLTGLYGTPTAVVSTGITTIRGEVRTCVPILDSQDPNTEGRP